MQPYPSLWRRLSRLTVWSDSVTTAETTAYDSESVIVAVYVLSTVVGGIVIGKLVRTRRFFWGLLLGNLYFILLLVITIILYRSLSGNGLNMLTAWILCTGGGMTGGMIS